MPLKDRRIGWKPIEHVCSVNGIVAWNASLRSMASMLIDRAVPSTCSCESHTRSMRLTTEASSSISLHQEHVLLVHGSGFSPTHGVGHARLVFLPPLEVIDEAFDRIDRFLSRI